MHACRHRLGPDQRQPSSGPAPPPAPRTPRHAAPHPCFAPLPAPLGLRFRALLGLGFVPPPEPRPCAHCASIAYALLPAARVPLCRHRADPESSSRSLPSGSPARIAPIAPAARIAPTVRRHPRHPPISLLALRRPQGPGWQEPRRMHPFFAECAKKAPFLATSARNACFSRSRWQHPRPMHPFPGAIGRFRMHGARILPPRALFRVEEPEITHGAKMLPAPPGLSPEAACGPTERALCHAAAACDTRHGRTGFAPCGAGLACLPHAPPPAVLLVSAAACASPPSRPRSSPPSYTRRASPPALRPPCPAIRHAAHCGRDEPPIGLFLLPSCCPTPTHRAHRCALAGTARAPTCANRAPALSQPSPAHPWSRLRPPVPRHLLPRGSRCGSGNSREMVR